MKKLEIVQNQPNDNTSKIESIKEHQSKEASKLKKIKKFEINEESNNSHEKSDQSDSSNARRNSYSIILRTSYDKDKNCKHSQISDSNKIENNSNNLSNINNISQNDSPPKKNYSKETSNKLSNKKNKKNEIANMIVEEDLNKNKDVMSKKEINENKDICENKEEISDNNQTYNPFIKKNRNGVKIKNEENNKKSNKEDNLMNKKGKIPIITLTTFQVPKANDKETGGKFSRFFKLFTDKKKGKEIIKNDNTKEEGEETKNKLMTLEEKLISENTEIGKKNEENLEDNNDNKNIKYNFVFGLLSSKDKDKKQNKVIDECEKLETNKEEEQKEKEQSKEFNNSFIIKAEPILNKNNKEESNNNIIDENNISSSEQIELLDKSSVYSYLSSSSFVKLIEKNSKYSALLLAILLGSCGLFYLSLKKINLKTLLSKISKAGILNNILPIFASGFEDFMERYNDIFRLLIGIIAVICLWIIIKIHIKCFMKGRKK
jgi:hypothetical protein